MPATRAAIRAVTRVAAGAAIRATTKAATIHALGTIVEI